MKTRLRCVSLEDRLAPAVITWAGNGAGNPNNWSNPNNWVGGKLPGPGDVAKFSSGVNAVVDVPQTVAGVEASFQTITLSAPLTTTGASVIDRVTFGGSSSWTNQGSISMGWFFGTPQFFGCQLVNTGTITILASSGISLAEAQLLNEPGGVIEIRATSNVINDIGSNPSLVSNQGVIRKTTDSASGQINARVVTVNGTWESESGLLQLNLAANSSHTNATFNTSGTGGIYTQSPFNTVLYSGTITVGGTTDGTLIFQGTVNVAAGGVTIQGSRVLSMFNCIVNGVPGGSVMTNLGSIAPTFVRLTGADLTVVNQGRMYTTTSNYIFELTQGAHLINDDLGVIDLGGNASFVNGGSSSATLTNRGLIRKSAGAGIAEIQSPIVMINPGGVIDVQAGSLSVVTGVVTQGGGVLGQGTLGGGLTNRGGFLRPNPVGSTLTMNGGYAQAADSIFIPEITGTATGSFTRAAVVGNVSLGGLITPVVNYAATAGDSFVVLANDGSDSITGTFANAAEGGSITVRGVTFQVTYKGGDGNDVALTVTNVAAPSMSPPKVAAVAVNGGGVQRSRVTGLYVQFDQAITQTGSIAQAFQLERQSDGAMVTLDGFDASYWNDLFTQFGVSKLAPEFAYLRFAGGPVEFGSLADGRYTLTIAADRFTSVNGSLDGNGDGTAGDDYELVGTPANGLFRLFGDVDGNGQVTTSDFLAFRLAFLGSSPVFDFDNDGTIGPADFLEFRLRFLRMV